MNKTILTSVVALIFISMSLSSCAAIEGIFNAGVGVGIFFVLFIIAIIVFIVMKGKKGA
ncbi:MAG: phosphatidate cytidylyltransferase [Saprospiraceae bacterium]|uniref:Phosphatidate cytidylyltransferase n=1 Tax=Candidatus Opimibacter skivensis TaxID=2982028 RepID=A0A9D7SV81_9BACT|nr:phosphatidate cytidylyltransferase [Candidatus Opimibacter skivensis]